jgi:hypothetical protein
MKLYLKLFEFLQMEQGDEISLNARNRDMSGALFLVVDPQHVGD